MQPIGHRILLMAVFSLVLADVFAAPNGKLQIHLMNVGQGDGAVLISPRH